MFPAFPLTPFTRTVPYFPMSRLVSAGGFDLPPRTIPLFKLESVAMGRLDRAITRVQPMSALGPGCVKTLTVV